MFGASWLVSTLIEGAHQNVSDLLYFALSSGYGTPNTTTAPYGGWGFGLTREAANDTNVLFAPYYALEMWSQAIPPGEPDVHTNSSAPSVVESYSAYDGRALSVILVNRANVPVTVNVSVATGNYTLGSVTTLDQGSYSETYLYVEGHNQTHHGGGRREPSAQREFDSNQRLRNRRDFLQSAPERGRLRGKRITRARGLDGRGRKRRGSRCELVLPRQATPPDCQFEAGKCTARN